MNQEFLDRLEQWNEEDKYQEIIDAIEALPEEALDFTLTSALARAYNNLAIDVMPPEDRPLYQRLVQTFLPGDVLVVKSIDRLGRNYGEILDQWSYITKTRETAIVVLDMPLLDTREGRDLTGTLIADIVLQLLSYVAQTEREFIRQRQAEGIAAAKGRGVRFGRKRIPMPDRFEELALDWWFGYISAVQAGKELGISRSTFTRRAEEWGSSQGLARE